MFRQLLGKHELLGLVKCTLVRRRVEIKRRLVVGSAFHGLENDSNYKKPTIELGERSSGEERGKKCGVRGRGNTGCSGESE